jgi:ABC-type polysaccharide/polyol phosphate export permease
MQDYLKAIWKCRYFWLSLVQMDLYTRYRRSVLGMGWSLLQPLAMTAILCLVFKGLMQEDLGSFGPYVLTGLATWNFFLGCVLQGCQCLYRSESYIRQYPAPLAIYPLRTALGCMIHFLIALGMVIVLAWCAQGFGNVATLVALVPALLLLLLLGWSLAVLTGIGNVYFQDTQHLAEIGFQLLFYATPIIYRKSILVNNGFGWVVQCNPLVAVLDLVRLPILEGGQWPDPLSVVMATGTVLLLTGAAVFTLVQNERQLVFRL